MSSQNQDGFTLIELMVMIAIIGLLAGALFPAVTQYSGRSRDTKRISDIRQLNIGLKGYFVDSNFVTLNTQSTPVDGATCIGVDSGGMCWNGYIFNTGVALTKGRTNGIPGNTTINNKLREYIPHLPIDPLMNRDLGDRYIISSGIASIHCNGVDNASGLGWIMWQPEKVNPRTNKSCLGQGNYGCCSGIGCGSSYFCITPIDT